MERERHGLISILIEVALVVGLYFAAKMALKDAGFGEWQKPLFGSAPLTALLVFFILPLIFVALRDLRPRDLGLGLDGFGRSGLSAFQAAAFVLPATMLFPVVSMLGFSAFGWEGAAILAIGFFGAGLLYLAVVRATPVTVTEGPAWSGFLFYGALFAAGLAGVYFLHPVSPVAARIVSVILFTAMLEELFFRGYLQTRLNEGFGTPFRFLGVDFGLGLILASVLFGLFHPLSSSADTIPWPWALWTGAFGLILGLLRERTGSILAPGLLHGLILVPAVFAGPAG